MADLTITLAGEDVVMLPERALYWPRTGSLFIADLHWGKAATLRSAAIALPGGTTTDDLARLSAVIERTGAGRVAVLGDLLHARAGRAPQTLAAITAWRARHPELELLLVRGNHDRHAGDPAADLGFECVDAPFGLGPFELRHVPATTGNGYVLAGHLHPGVVLNGPARQRIQLPCFWFGYGGAVLPAFGSVTGSARITPLAGDRVFAVAEGEILAVSGLR